MAETTVTESAPYPTDKLTADALARYLAVSAWRTWADVPRLLHEWEAAGLPTTGPQRDAFVGAVQAASAQFAAAYLLRQVGDSLTPDELADVNLPYAGWSQHAADHVEAWMDGWGIDPEQVLAEASGERPS